jgi:hypothetical protein
LVIITGNLDKSKEELEELMNTFTEEEWQRYVAETINRLIERYKDANLPNYSSALGLGVRLILKHGEEEISMHVRSIESNGIIVGTALLDHEPIRTSVGLVLAFSIFSPHIEDNDF